ncbi:TA system toxin CbtA family protein [Enterobacter ludwigii]|uniref:TA system toxin CbtA family protein n=1 Tax=Enterobacter cloacae complex TaxID=354276 RepID=UPI0013D101B0|nr:TA system toxin CbtA family protein [Enterobacter ludwigii]
MRIYPVSAKRADEIERLSPVSPVAVWQRLLTYLLDRHYGLAGHSATLIINGQSSARS